MSTPYGKRGHFYEAWNETTAWHRVEVPATECPRITPEFLQNERKALGDLWFRQEYECQFADVIDAVFRMADIERALTDDVKPLFETAPDEGLLARYSREGAQRLRRSSFDIEEIARRGLGYERLDQLMLEHLMGVRAG